MNIFGTLDEQAAEWCERLADEPTKRVRDEFSAWLDGREDRAAAFSQADRARRAASALANEPEMRRLRAETLSGVQARKRARQRYRSRVAGTALAGGAMAASIALVLNFAFPQAKLPAPAALPAEIASLAPIPQSATLPDVPRQIYESKVGQQRVIELADHSSITLDSNTRLSVSYTSSERAISLTRGQAYFKVAHDISRPFVVTAGKSKVIALGTEFDVSVASDSLAVHLVEGRLRIEKSIKGERAGQQIATLAAGQKLLLSSDNTISVKQVDALAETEWRHGKLVFDRERLGDVVAKFNRYRQAPIRLEGEELADTMISGVFETDRSDDFVEAITSSFPIDATDGNDGAIWLRRRR